MQLMRLPESAAQAQPSANLAISQAHLYLRRDAANHIEEIARLVGHASTRTTEIVYRRELRPVITTGAEIMDELFSGT